MVDVPTSKDVLVNLFITLYAVSEASRRGVVDGRVKLMKLLQKAEEELGKKNMRGPSFKFYKWKYGAWSPEAQFDREVLTRRGLLSEDEEGHVIEITTEGREIIDSSRKIIEKNREIMDVINRALASHVQYKSWQLRDLTYATSVLGREKRRMEQTTIGEVVLSPIEEEKASKFFLVDDEWLDMIATSVSEEFRQLLEQVPEKPDLTQYEPIASLRTEYGLQ